jgi:hypothetical protein
MTSKKTLRIVVWVFFLGLLLAFGSIYYVFNMPHRNLAKETPSFTLSATQLISEFKKDEVGANKKYLNQALSISGQVKSVRNLENHGMVFSLEDAMEGVSCSIDSVDVVKYKSKLSTITEGTKASFKGRCSGMLMDIQLINCVPE